MQLRKAISKENEDDTGIGCFKLIFGIFTTDIKVDVLLNPRITVLTSCFNPVASMVEAISFMQAWTWEPGSI